MKAKCEICGDYAYACECGRTPEQGLYAPKKEIKKWYLGAQNDGLFIINQPPAPANDHPRHDAQVEVIAAVPDGAADFAETIIAAHNAAISG